MMKFMHVFIRSVVPHLPVSKSMFCLHMDMNCVVLTLQHLSELDMTQ